MKRHVLFVHGGGEEAYEEDRKLAESLRDVLGAAYEVRCPLMPDADSPEYGAWRDRISEELTSMDGETFLVGHSLGASFLLKYASEEAEEKPVAGLFLVAPPFWGAEDWEVGEYELPPDFASKLPEDLPVFIYHSRDDEVVPFAHLALHAEKLPRSTVREFDGRGHQFDDDLSEVARDIQELQRRPRGEVDQVRDEPSKGVLPMVDGSNTDLPRELSRPARRALAGAGYARLEQLTGVTEAEVLKLHGMGPKALDQLRGALAARGQSFAAPGDPGR